MNATRARQARAAAWVFFGALILVRVAVGELGLSIATENVISAASLYLAPMLLAFVASVVAMRRFHGAEQRFWGLMAVATACLLLSESYWEWYAARVDFRGPPVPGAFELFQLVAVGIFLWIVISMTRLGGVSRTEHLRVLLDVLAGLTIGVGAVYWFWTLPLFGGASGGHTNVALIAAIYPAIGAVLLIASVAVALGWRSSRWRSWERLVAASFAIFAVGILSFPAWYAGLVRAAQPVPDGWFTPVLGLGYYLLFVALVYRITSSNDGGSVEQWSLPSAGPAWVAVLYTTALLLSAPFLGWIALIAGGQPGGLVIVMLAVALAAILVLRSWVGSVERSLHRSIAVTDPLTGLYNYRFLHERLADNVADAAANSRVLAVVCFDIDDFEQLNTLWGHVVGDAVLVRVAGALCLDCPAEATVCRLGGDDFTVVLPGCDESDAAMFFERVRSRIEDAPYSDGPRVTVTAGIATYPDHGLDVDQLVTGALAALQTARASDERVNTYDPTQVEFVNPRERMDRVRRRAQRTTVRALAAAVDARDPDSAHHSENVAELARGLAQVLGLPEERIDSIGIAARLHDVGKIGIRGDILHKSAALTDEERALVESHPVLGEQILAPTHLDGILPTVRHHHERWDGTGYPDGLAAEEIPLDARILAVCDAFEAMTSNRDFRTALSVAHAITEIERRAGTQFDPEVASAFNRMVARLHGQTMRDRIRLTGVSRSDF